MNSVNFAKLFCLRVFMPLIFLININEMNNELFLHYRLSLSGKAAVHNNISTSN